MKQKMSVTQISRYVSLMRKQARSKCVFTPCAPLLRAGFWILIVCASFAAVPAQVTPLVCFDAKPETFTRTLTNSQPAGQITFSPNLDQGIPRGFYRVVFDPGGATQETLIGVNTNAGATVMMGGSGFPSQAYLHPHPAGQRVDLITEGDGVYGYSNPGSSAVNIPRGVSSQNFFAPGPLVYSTQPTLFQPGVHADAMRLKVISALTPTWFLSGVQATPSINAGQGCAAITYQGRLSDAGSAASGQFDLQFQAFDLETAGVAQSGLITLENVQVTGGIFTVPLQFGSTLINNFKARFLQIGVRPGSAAGSDPFTILTPRQPITSVPYAINAQNAVNAATATTAASATTAANATNAINATNATNAANATNATNASQLGGVPAADYLTNNSVFGQNVTTALGTGHLTVNSATTAYTLVPGLTQTINVPANSSLMISTDGGILSTGAVNTYSVVDVAVYVDGTIVANRRIVIGNTPLPSSVGNWALGLGQTLAAGSHTIEVRARNGIGGSAAATVSNNADPLLRGQLTVAVIRK